jgi:hypothetical protein
VHIAAVHAGDTTVRVCAAEVPPYCDKFTTVILLAPAVDTSAAEIGAVSVVESANVVVRAEPLKFIIDDPIKFVPVRVKVNAPLFIGTEVGDISVIFGGG